MWKIKPVFTVEPAVESDLYHLQQLAIFKNMFNLLLAMVTTLSHHEMKGNCMPGRMLGALGVLLRATVIQSILYASISL